MISVRFAVFACLLVAFAARAPAQEDLRATLFADADRALEQARAVSAELLAPATFARGTEAYAGAEADLARGRNMERIRSSLATAARAFMQAEEAAEIANVTLAAVIKTRADAKMRTPPRSRPSSGPRPAKASIPRRAGSRPATSAARAAAPTRPRHFFATPSSRRSKRST